MANKITELYDAEKELIRQAHSGEFADFSDISEWPDKRRIIRSEVLRSLLLRLKLPALEEATKDHSHDVRSIGAISPIIEGKLDLVEAIGWEERSLPPLILKHAVFKGSTDGTDIDARHARMARLSLENCKFTRIDLTNAKVGGDVDLSGVKPNAKGWCQILAQGCHVEGAFRADGARLKIPSPEARTKYALDLTNANIEGDVSLQCRQRAAGGTKGAPEHDAGATGDGQSFYFDALGGVCLDLARVRGSVWINGARLERLPAEKENEEEGYALHAHNCRIEGGLHMSANKNEAGNVDRFRAYGCVSLMGARIYGNLDCRGALLQEVSEKNTDWLEASRALTDKDWSYSLDARDVIVSGDVLFQVSRYKQKGQHLLFEATSRVCLSGANIGGELRLLGARLSKELNLNNAEINSNVYLGSGSEETKSDDEKAACSFISNQAVTLRNARIKGRFECRKATLKHPGTPRELGWALDASEFRVAGNLVFSPKLEADATFERCRVGGDLDLSGLQLDITSSAAPSVVFSDFIIDRRIAITLEIKVTGKQAANQVLFDPTRPHIWLDGVEVGILADDGGKGWGSDVRLTLDGLVYKHVEQAGGPVPKEDVFSWAYRRVLGKYHLRISEDRKEWLKLQYERRPRRFSLNPRRFGTPLYVIERITYRAQPYEQLARVLDDQGWNEDLRHVLMHKLRLDGMWVPWALKPFHKLFGMLFGFGLAHRKAAVVLAAYLCLGGFAFNYASNHHILVLDQSPVTTAFANKKDVFPPIPNLKIGQSGTPETPDISLDTSDIDCGTTISPWVYALDAAIPFMDLREHQRCTIRTPEEGRWAYKWPSRSDWKISFDTWDFSEKYGSLPSRHIEFAIPFLTIIDSEEVAWRYFKAAYTVIGWLITSITVLTLTGVLRRAAEQ